MCDGIRDLALIDGLCPSPSNRLDRILQLLFFAYYCPVPCSRPTCIAISGGCDFLQHLFISVHCAARCITSYSFLIPHSLHNMYPTVMPQSELLARLENNASMTDKLLALRDSRKQRQATVEDEPTSSSEESESDSESDSGSDSDIAAPPKRPISPPKPTGPLRDEQRPNRKISTEKSAQPRPKSAAPVLRRTQRSPHRISSDASVAMASSGLEPLKPSRPRSATSPVDHAHQPIIRRPTSRTPSPKSSEVTAKKPNALSFLDPDSPQVTEEQIRRVMAETSGQWSPRSVSSSSSSNDSISHRSVAETDATTPEQSVNGDISVQFHGNSFFQPGSSPSRSRSGSQVQRPRSRQEAEEQEHKYGTPEMARGPAKHPHIHPKELQPRLAAPGQGHAKHLPRAEKLPMSGYELLAAKLSSPQSSRSRRRSYSKTMPTEEGEPMIKPIYRRFENLNHRLLLHLQDELSELEEQLHRLDTADTQTRRLANCILPASRRADFMAGGELQWHKADILGKVGYKLGQYSTSIHYLCFQGVGPTNRLCRSCSIHIQGHTISPFCVSGRC